jgi:glycosyltransferase involved in cell wall biosynthesis
MLTWSDWKTEPRSNRYHYATRFAKHLPVLFVQPDLPHTSVLFEETEIEGIEILHVFSRYGCDQSQEINTALLKRGFIKPLLWIYNPHFVDFIRHRYAPLKVYHATEDYFAPEYNLDEDFYTQLRQVFSHTDLLVAVSEEVLNSYLTTGGYQSNTLLLKNGCDYDFWALTDDEVQSIVNRQDERKIAFYQGGLNKRLDWDLLRDLAVSMPDWDFWLCGMLEDDYKSILKTLPSKNVSYLGYLHPQQIRDAAVKATVGIIPFLQNRMIEISLPLKAFEYVACGLPVVSVPILALESYDHTFEIARTSEEFADALRKAAPIRQDANEIRRRLAVAKNQDYNVRFTMLVESINEVISQRAPSTESFNILMLYDAGSVHVVTITEYLKSFSEYSRSKVYYASCTNGAECTVDLSAFDVIAIHYSVRLCYDWHLSPSFAQAIRNFGGYKLLFIQDEYDTPETTRRWIESLGIHAVFTCVPDKFVDQVYPSARFPYLERIQVLTGYVPIGIETYETTPTSERETVIGYRGRPLPFYYGDLGQEKMIIAREMRKICEDRGILVDIEWTHEKRIYGDGWYDFVRSSKATLGTESGSNVFDDYGDIKANIENALQEDPSLSYEEVHARFIGEREGQIMMNQVSPRIFEAIAFRTALVLFEGNYSGVIQPNIHYIPLKKDFSNVDEVLSRLQDDNYLECMTERAYQDVIASGAYTYKKFLETIDDFLSKRVLRSNGDALLMGLIGIRFPDINGVQLANYEHAEHGLNKVAIFSEIPLNTQEAVVLPIRTDNAAKYQVVGDRQLLQASLSESFRLFRLMLSHRLQKYPAIHETVYSIYKAIRSGVKFVVRK